MKGKGGATGVKKGKTPVAPPEDEMNDISVE